MKKTLLATSALAFAGAMAAGSAGAADKLSVGVGGFMEQWVGMANLDDGSNGFAVHSDSEFNVKGALEADNGLKFSVKIEVEGNGPGNIDESQATVSGSFGQIVLGAEDSVFPLMHAGHQDVGIGMNHGDISSWIPGVSTFSTSHWTADAKAVSYYSPRLSGVQFGMSYIPDVGSEACNCAPEHNDNDAWAVGLNAEHNLGDASVKFSVGHRTINSGAMQEFTFEDGAQGKLHSLTRADFTAANGIWDDYVGRVNSVNPLSSDSTVQVTSVDEVAININSRDLAAQARAYLDSTPKQMVMKGTDSSTTTNMGLQVGFGAFGINVAYADYDRPASYMVMDDDVVVLGAAWDHDGDASTDPVPQTTVNNPGDDIVRQKVVEKASADSEIITVGAIYTEGPMAASIGYAMEDRANGTDSSAVMLSFRYTLAPGINSKTSLFQAEDSSTGADGTAFVTGITLGF